MQEVVKRDHLIRTVNDKKASGELNNLKITDTFAASFPIDDGGEVVVTITLANAKALRLLAIPQISVYIDNSSIEANRLYGQNFKPEFDFDFYNWQDWATTDDNNIVYKVAVRHKSISDSDPHLVIVRGNFRYLIEEAE